MPPGQIWGRFFFLLVFLEGASGTICNTMGCNFTLDYTFALKLLLFPPQDPSFLPPHPFSILVTSSVK